MRSAVIWIGLLIAILTLIFHIIHIAADYEFVFLNVAVILIALGVAPFPV